MAYKHDDKSSGQLIRSADWNLMGHEIERLETDKVNRAGDTIKGDLTVTGKAQLGSLAVTGDASTTGKVQFGPLTVSGDASISGRAQLGSLAVTGSVGIGTTNPKAKLQIVGGAIMPSTGNDDNSGIMFPRDPFGGGADSAWIRYHNARGGEKGTLEIGINNDADDHIVLNPSGNVGIGVLDPQNKLDINGNLKVMGDRIRSADSLGIIQTNAKDWLRINPDSHYPSIALYNPVAIVTGGLSIGDWSQMPQGQLKVTGQAQLGSVVIGSLQLSGFTDADRDEWPNVFWYRDPGKNWDEGLIKHSSTRGKFGRAGFGVHFHQAREFGLWSTGWDPLFAVEGGTGNAYFKGNLDIASIRIRDIYTAGHYFNISFEPNNQTIVFYHQSGAGQFMKQDGNWQRNSDISLKEDIFELEGVLNRAIKLKPVKFRWKCNQIEDIGFIAQEVEKIFPELVSTTRCGQDGDQEMKGLPYSHFGVLAIAAIREIKELYDKKLENLEKKVLELCR